MKLRDWLLGAAAGGLLAIGAPALAQSVEAGIEAWQAGNYAEAIRNWRPRADAGDQDAQFNLGHAYRLGRGVPQNMNLAEQWYERAARSGHVEAQAMYGLILFQNGRRQEAMPFVQRAAENGDARAQYVYGTALFNGDIVTRDWARAYAFMTSAAAQGLPYAQSQLAEIERHITDQDRARGTELAQALRSQAGPPVIRPAGTVETSQPRVAGTNRPARVATTDIPPSSATGPARQAVRPTPPAQSATRPVAPTQGATRPVVPPAAAGRWRVQLGAFSSEANARRAWSGVSGRLPGLQPALERAGNLIRLQAGPLPSRAAAERACAALGGQACFPVGS
jgi:cell division septation protein DedD